MLAGFAPGAVRRLPVDDRFRIRQGALREATARDRGDGLEPFLVVANAGTTNTGAVDELDPLADFCAAERLWLHVDAAYGGFFMLTERGPRLDCAGSSARTRSVSTRTRVCSCPTATVACSHADVDDLRRAHQVHAEYMPPMQEDRELVDFCDISPELSRDFRGLRVWLPLTLAGRGPLSPQPRREARPGRVGHRRAAHDRRHRDRCRATTLDGGFPARTAPTSTPRRGTASMKSSWTASTPHAASS